MNLNLKDKIAFITGASSGIGASTAELFAAEGADVVIGFGKNERGAKMTAHTVRELGRNAWLCQMEIGEDISVQRAVRELKTKIDHLDILVLCAGFNRVTPLADVTTDEWIKVININLNGAFYVLQNLRSMLRPGGAVVTVSSVAAHTGAPHHAHYAAAKAGLTNLTKTAARDLAPDIRVNCVAPGITLTRMGEATASNLPSSYAKDKLLLKRFATPDEIARCIVFLASPAASFVTGATLHVNGGRDLR